MKDLPSVLQPLLPAWGEHGFGCVGLVWIASEGKSSSGWWIFVMFLLSWKHGNRIEQETEFGGSNILEV